MQEVRRNGQNVTITATTEELRAVGATLLEALNGGYAFPDDIWTELVGFPRERVQAALDDVMRMLDA